MPHLRRYDEGKEVRALQEDLIALGYALPRWGADGHLGDETFAAVAEFEEDHGLAPSPPDEVSVATLDAIHQCAAASGASLSPVLDVTGKHPGSQRHGSRTWTDITGITLHQTACVLGEKPERWYSLRAHIGVTREGQIILVNGLTSVVYHGNGFNSHDVGLEVDGTFEGVEGQPATFWKPSSQPELTPMVPSPTQLEACRVAVQWICDEVKRHGGMVSNVHAHRMASATRRSDPGSRVWQDVGIWAQQSLGLSDQGAGYTISDGRPIPQAWDPRRLDIDY